MYKETYITYTDKKVGDSHSFIDDMICDELSKQLVCRSIVVMNDSSKGLFVSKKNKAALIGVPIKRSGLQRFCLIVYSFFLTWSLLKRFKHEKITILVRNEPCNMMGAALSSWLFGKLNNKKVGLIFQSSFPLEIDVEGFSFKNLIARKMITLLLPFYDKCIVVSEEAKKRIRKYNKKITIDIIPLCVNKRFICFTPKKGISSKKLNLLYIGTHAKIRNLEEVYLGIFYAFKQGLNICLDSVGASKSDIKRLEKNKEIAELVSRGIVRFHEKCSRSELDVFFQKSDIGLNLIPPLPIYKESSSTKLIEYMAKGLPVISSSGIPYHHEIHNASNTGWLVEFNSNAITKALINVNNDWKKSNHSKETVQFVIEKMTYDRFVKALCIQSIL
ncbi:glycosyltransferase [Endozoicomonas gorgoniicola]|uniref:Glycosyltransferase n=1 Tax=Endozoicomonas gorgoniicola TaxID=1234144 RepID=A0ABT3MUU9_9GAMM|nr:glycosyltransferase [Endozoicomonas gorgoniicola]MCW7553162.1 glycosyltransferase [Endozoicomonas gorgoniicola]